MHISKGKPNGNSTKVWLTKAGGCILANNKSQIPQKELNILLEAISLYYFKILSEWKQINGEELKFYC